MASPRATTESESDVRRFTIADLAALPTHLPSGDVDWELDKGRLIVLSPHTVDHGSAQTRIGAQLYLQGVRAGHGRAFTNAGVVLSRNPDTVVGPDVGFIGRSKLPVRESPEGFLETMPDLVVEIRERGESRVGLERRSLDYLSAGIGVVWIADSEAKTIVVHRASSAPCVFGEAEILAADEPIPGFRLNLADVFCE